MASGAKRKTVELGMAEMFRAGIWKDIREGRLKQLVNECFWQQILDFRLGRKESTAKEVLREG
jgi:hypothetical protein